MNSQEKTRFRARKIWKEFREALILQRNKTCELCGKKKSSPRLLDCHHVYPDDYEDLKPEKFKILCTQCHDFVEYMGMRAGGKDPIPRLELFQKYLGDFIPRITKKALDFK